MFQESVAALSTPSGSQHSSRAAEQPAAAEFSYSCRVLWLADSVWGAREGTGNLDGKEAEQLIMMKKLQWHKT